MAETVTVPAEVLAVRLLVAELVGRISRHFIGIHASEVHNGVEGALESVVAGLGFERGLIAALSKDKNTFRVVHRYGLTPAEFVFATGETFPVTALPWLSARIVAGETILVERDRYPEDAVIEREFFARVGMAWHAFYPLQVGGEVLGCVGFMGKKPWNDAHEEGLKVVSQIIASAWDRKRAEEELQQTHRLTELVGEVSRRFIDLPVADLGRGMDDALRKIAELYAFVRGVIYELSDDRRTFSITHRYLAPGVDGTLPTHTPIPAEHYAYALSRLTDTKPLVLSRDTLPPEARREREELEEGPLRHVILLPLIVAGSTFGATTFETHEMPSHSLIDALGVIGELFSNAIDRERVDRALNERLRFEEALSEISARLVGDRVNPLDSTVLDALGEVGRALGFDRVSLFELVGERARFKLTNEWCAEGIPSFAPSTLGISVEEFGWPLTVLREGHALVFGLEDVPADAKSCRQVLERDGTRLFATVPLVISGDVIGCIGFHRIRSARKLPADQLRRLRLVGAMVADAMARRNAEASLARSDARFGKVVASALDGFVMVNQDTVILEWTPQTEHILGWPRGEMLGGALHEIFVLETMGAGTPYTGGELYRAAQHAASERVEVLGKHRDGKIVPLELSISVLESNGPTVYSIFVRDITERKRAEKLRQQAFEEIARLKVQIEGERDYLREEVRSGRRSGDFVGHSEGLQGVLHLIESVATTSATVLIRGESGVGKELVARAIHARSGRAEGPLVKVNCASIPKELFESEFFGHVRGAFTGAHKDRIGRFELANHGTLFLDEVGEIPLVLQSKLLRVLQESEFERVGDDRTRRTDVRVIVATNRDLESEVSAGTFRKDLYYRLSVFPVEVPPLRYRREDIVPLAEHFLRTHARDLGRDDLTLDDEQRRKLQEYDWPGNVRELQHVIERAVILSARPPLRLEPALHPAGTSTTPPTPGRLLTEAELRKLERENLLSALERCNWQISGSGGAAEMLGINASTLRDRMRSFEIKRTPAA